MNRICKAKAYQYIEISKLSLILYFSDWKTKRMNCLIALPRAYSSRAGDLD
jgi:hypothetical protein